MFPSPHAIAADRKVGVLLDTALARSPVTGFERAMPAMAPRLGDDIVCDQRALEAELLTVNENVPGAENGAQESKLAGRRAAASAARTIASPAVTSSSSVSRRCGAGWTSMRRTIGTWTN